jgi:Protein of unknown function (DUF2924)
MTTIPQQLAALERLSVKQLQQRYVEVFGEATNGHNKTWLVRRIAWKIQANSEGGLSERAKRKALELAGTSELRTTIPTPRAKAESVTTPLPASNDKRLPPPGSIITRNYKGQSLQVRVLATGFEFAGTSYPSLSAVAKAITGSHCNGFLFFNLTAKGAK